MAEKGRGSREVIENLASDVRTFIQIVSEEICLMRQEANGLRGDWDDEKYEEFLAYIESLSSSLSSDLNELEDVERHLNIILDKMS